MHRSRLGIHKGCLAAKKSGHISFNNEFLQSVIIIENWLLRQSGCLKQSKEPPLLADGYIRMFTCRFCLFCVKGKGEFLEMDLVHLACLQIRNDKSWLLEIEPNSSLITPLVQHWREGIINIYLPPVCPLSTGQGREVYTRVCVCVDGG